MFALANYLTPNEPIKSSIGNDGDNDQFDPSGGRGVVGGSRFDVMPLSSPSFCGGGFVHDISVGPVGRKSSSSNDGGSNNNLRVSTTTTASSAARKRLRKASMIATGTSNDSSSIFSSTTSTSSSSMNSDTLLAKEFTQLSMAEREQVFADLHGVSDIYEETSELLDHSFTDLECEIRKIKKRPAYEKALFLDPQYVQNRDFRVKFLRADRFDTKAAAQRMVNHFEFKFELFGYDKLARDITFQDLKPQDQHDCLHGGYWFLKQPDRSGRRLVLLTLEQIYKLDSTHCELLWYMYMNALEDVYTQRNGIAQVMFCMNRAEIARTNMSNPKPAFNVEIIANCTRLYSCLPFRLVALHVCCDDMKNKPPFLNIFQMAVEMKYRFRFRMHHGSQVEIQYELGSYGIPTCVLPFDDNGMLNLALYLKEFKERIAIEEQRKQNKLASGRIDHPSPYDVLLGRGRPYQEYPGNINLAKLVEQNQDAYEKGERCEKAMLAKHVVNQICAMGGKFLKRPDDIITPAAVASGDATIIVGGAGNGSGNYYPGWEIVDDETIKIKVGNSFRTKRKLEKRKEQGMKRKGAS